MNKYTERLKTILSVSLILKVQAPIAKKSVLYKKSKQTKSILTKPSFLREKKHVQRFNFSLFQTFSSRKFDNIFAMPVIEIAKFESLLRFFASILENTLGTTIRKDMAQSCQTR